MMNIEDYISKFSSFFPIQQNPWEITQKLPEILYALILNLNKNYIIKDGIAIHRTACIEEHVVLKPPVIIGQNCCVGANAYLRGGIYLADSSRIGPGCEIKTSIIFPHSAITHFNFIGDSIIGRNVNFEAGAVTANHYNERNIKNIYVLIDSSTCDTGTEKFGSLIGDNSKIGANAVLSPGTILKPGSIVKRLELVEQVANTN